MGLNKIYDPCNGYGGITEQLEGAGIECVKSDLIDYGIGDTIENFLDVDRHIECDAIVFNPPFKLTSEFIDKALSISDRVIMFNRVSFLETVKRAKKLQGEWCLTDIYFHTYRVGCSKGNKKEYKSAVFYAWFVFDRKKYHGVTQAHWITSRPNNIIQ